MSNKAFLFCVGANHKTADLSIREELFINPDAITKVLRQHLQQNELQETMVISTCNRLELTAVSHRALSETQIIEVFASLQNLARLPRAPLSKDIIDSSILQFHQQDAVEHMFAVASGLDSLVIGETQITGQFKNATRIAKELDTMGPVLDRLCQDALATAGKVRTNTDIGKKTVSISHAAIELASRVYGDLSDHNVLIIGAGEMSRVAAQNAVKHGAKNLIILNRTLENAESLVKEIGFGQALEFDHLAAALQVSDIVISSTSKQGFVLDVSTIQKAQNTRQHRPLFLIDIALPRDIHPGCSDIDNTYLFDIDDLKQVVAEHIEERRLAAEKAAGMVTDSALNYMRWLDHLGLKPALSGFRSYLEDLIRRETDRTLNRGHLKNLDDHQKQAIEKLLKSVVGKISSDAGKCVTAPPDGFYKDQLAAALSALFPIPSQKEES